MHYGGPYTGLEELYYLMCVCVYMCFTKTYINKKMYNRLYIKVGRVSCDRVSYVARPKKDGRGRLFYPQ